MGFWVLFFFFLVCWGIATGRDDGLFFVCVFGSRLGSSVVLFGCTFRTGCVVGYLSFFRLLVLSYGSCSIAK